MNKIANYLIKKAQEANTATTAEQLQVLPQTKNVNYTWNQARGSSPIADVGRELLLAAIAKLGENIGSEHGIPTISEIRQREADAINASDEDYPAARERAVRAFSEENSRRIDEESARHLEQLRQAETPESRREAVSKRLKEIQANRAANPTLGTTYLSNTSQQSKPNYDNWSSQPIPTQLPAATTQTPTVLPTNGTHNVSYTWLQANNLLARELAYRNQPTPSTTNQMPTLWTVWRQPSEVTPSPVYPNRRSYLANQGQQPATRTQQPTSNNWPGLDKRSLQPNMTGIDSSNAGRLIKGLFRQPANPWAPDPNNPLVRAWRSGTGPIRPESLYM